MNPQSGQLLGGRYRLTDRIAVGGMGEVWKAEDDVLGRLVAVKVLKPEFTGDAGFLTRFRNEARHTAALAHPNIAGVYDYGEADASAFLVMELVPGEPLGDLLDREGPLPVPRAMNLLAQAAHGLSAAHAAGVVHRDVKPGNLLVTPDGRVKVTDFGIARAGDQVPLTKTGQVMGTAQYLAPEQAMGLPAGPASDVYALGVVGFEALTGRRPFPGESPVAIAMAHVNTDPPPLPEHLPEGARALIASSMAKDPADRPADAAVFAAAAEAVARGQDAEATAMLPATALMPGAAAGAAAGGAAAAAARAASSTRVLPTTAPQPSYAGGRTAAGAATRGGPRRRRRTMTGPLLALLALLAFVAVGALLASDVLDGTAEPGATPTTQATEPAATTPTETTPERTTATTPPPTTTTQAGIVLNRDDYVGREKGEVKDELERLGLKVREEKDQNADAEKDTVVEVRTAGEPLQEGDEVTVVFADPKGKDDDGGDDGAPGRTDDTKDDA